jgi:hypothetical protein
MRSNWGMMSIFNYGTGGDQTPPFRCMKKGRPVQISALPSMLGVLCYKPIACINSISNQEGKESITKVFEEDGGKAALFLSTGTSGTGSPQTV